MILAIFYILMYASLQYKYYIVQNFDRGVSTGLTLSVKIFNFNIFYLYSKYRLSKRLSVNISPIKLLNEANLSILPSVKILRYTVDIASTFKEL